MNNAIPIGAAGHSGKMKNLFEKGAAAFLVLKKDPLAKGAAGLSGKMEYPISIGAAGLSGRIKDFFRKGAAAFSI